ncbi:NifU N-terminal domain-containing protein [Aliicoccus persicus]|uniref:NifU N-terminal domain-containing protein n=1 Tax=Aliicoccus persicus TaxID=930138 RepID=A0A662Z4A0_9STAP|nr:NifU N-terminal domain-containing protein [Aliicoccus persicus]SEV83235.1 Scaffold protein Nfu/NifU N terminal [Aliicoccus persicus]HJE19677.1 NifU N-terminal domain-containing protein [Aliicoccus persicus]
MRVLQIDATPNPDSMKLTLDFDKEGSRSSTYDRVEEDNPKFINDLLQIEGVRSLFHAINFVTVDKKPDYEWEQLIDQVVDTIDNQE